jgi:hypothetical protein
MLGICVLEGLLRMLAEFYRGIRNKFRFLYFALGDFGFKLSILISTIITYTFSFDNLNFQNYFKIIFVLGLIRVLILILSLLDLLRSNHLFIKRNNTKLRICLFTFFVGLRSYWKTVGTSILSEAGSSTILAIFLTRIQALAGLEAVGLIRLMTQIVSVFNTPTSIIEGYISPALKAVTRNGTDFSKLLEIRYYLITINLLIVIFSFISMLVIDILDFSPIINHRAVLALMLLLFFTLLRSVLGAPYLILMSTGVEINRTYASSILGLALTFFGILMIDEVILVVAIFAFNFAIIDLIICIQFTFFKKYSNGVDYEYFSLFRLFYYARSYPRFISGMTIEKFFNAVKSVRD